jgi:N-acyl-D-aspartate/D-glutamate deacylase
MGDRGGQNAEATPDEIEAMAKVVREAVEAGAVGFSTTRTLLHRAKDGELAAGTTASADELIGIGMALGEAGSGVFELASDMITPESEFAWMATIARETGRPVTFNCLQDDMRPEHWRRLIELADEATAAGARIVPQVAGRPASVLFGWDSTAHPFLFNETWQAIADLPRDERMARLRDPDVRAAMVAERPQISGIAAFLTSAFHKLFPLGDPPEYEPAPDRSVQAVAEREGRTPQEVTYDLMMADDGRGLLYIPLLGYAHGDFGALHDMLVHPGTVLGLGDGGAHCGLLCDASLPTYMLSHWVRDRSRGDRLGLEQAVHLQTRSTAALYGFDDRGLLAPGYLADVNVIDFDALAIDAPEMVYDLPAGGRRLVQRSRGYAATVKRGVVVRECDRSTGERPGRLLRGPQPAPAG